jgi:hypothetical protein
MEDDLNFQVNGRQWDFWGNEKDLEGGAHQFVSNVPITWSMLLF